MKIVKKFQLKIVIFTDVKNRCMLHGHVFVMKVKLFMCGLKWWLCQCSSRISYLNAEKRHECRVEEPQGAFSMHNFYFSSLPGTTQSTC